MHPLIILLLSIAVFVGVFGSLYLIYIGFSKNQHNKQVKEHVAVIQEETTSASRQKLANKMDDSFTNRIIIPLAQALSERIEEVIPTSGQSFIRKKLVHAGYSKPAHLKTFIGIQAMLTFGPALLIFLYFLAHKISLQVALISIPIGSFIGFAFPLLWLIDNTSKRQLSIHPILKKNYINIAMILI